MANKDLTQELLDVETRFWQALKEKDTDTAMQLTDKESIVTGAQGIERVTRQQLSDLLQNAPYTMHAFELSDAQALEVKDDVAILVYKVHEELTVEGKPVKLDAVDASTWVRRNDGWKCALHTESIVGDPFGRDRRQA